MEQRAWGIMFDAGTRAVLRETLIWRPGIVESLRDGIVAGPRAFREPIGSPLRPTG
jgi:hypothetical protein